jgi:hypothetical protein
MFSVRYELIVYYIQEIQSLVKESLKASRVVRESGHGSRGAGEDRKRSSSQSVFKGGVTNSSQSFCIVEDEAPFQNM